VLLISMLTHVGSGSPTAAVRSAAGTGSSDSAGSSWLSPSDLGMRSDTLVSPRVSPLMQHRRVPSLVITSSIDKSGNLPVARLLTLLLLSLSLSLSLSAVNLTLASMGARSIFFREKSLSPYMGARRNGKGAMCYASPEQTSIDVKYVNIHGMSVNVSRSRLP